MVTGAAPGLGKSTLARSLSAALAREGRIVTTFMEEDIGERVEFADVMASFRATGRRRSPSCSTRHGRTSPWSVITLDSRVGADRVTREALAVLRGDQQL